MAEIRKTTEETEITENTNGDIKHISHLIKPVCFASVGTGMIAHEFAETVKNVEGARHEAVYSRSEEKARAFSERFGVSKAYTSFDSIINDDNIDAVYIASPNSCHAPQAKQFLEAGKHVLCEKPLCSNARLAKELIALAVSRGLVLMEAYKSGFMPGMSVIAENIRKLGKIRSVFFSFGKYSSRYDAHKAGGDVNTFKREFSNGGMLDLGIYCLYPMLLLFGAPREVKAVGSIVPGGVDGVGFSVFSYDGFCACNHYSKISNAYLPCEIEGEDATMTINRLNIPTEIEIRFRNGKTERPSVVAREDSMCYELSAFSAAVAATKNGGETDVRFPFENPASPFAASSHALSVCAAEITDEIRRQIGVVYDDDLI